MALENKEHTFYFPMLAAPRETVHSGHAQTAHRSACASTQSDQGFQCSVTEALDTTECMESKARMRSRACAGRSESAQFAHVRRHVLLGVAHIPAAHDVYTTSTKRRCNAMTLHRR